jgi:RHS repeat-associated protein
MPPEQDIEYHAYGEQQVYTDTLGQEYRFTGKEHDPETNNDYFGARYYSSTMGRFLTPDWSATPVPIPYAVMGNPQTLNLYSYVENNPITSTDPDGHYTCAGSAANASPCPGDNQAPDVRQDAKKEAERKKKEEEIAKKLAQLKAFIAKA